MSVNIEKIVESTIARMNTATRISSNVKPAAFTLRLTNAENRFALVFVLELRVCFFSRHGDVVLDMLMILISA